MVHREPSFHTVWRSSTMGAVRAENDPVADLVGRLHRHELFEGAGGGQGPLTTCIGGGRPAAAGQ